ncbi:MAG: hypothetical protein WBO32_11040 [Cyclobacteriaceae bacterium]
MSKKLNYNTDIVKHYVRHFAWKEPYRIIKNHVEKEVLAKQRSERCKYLTFCAVQAIDIFMLELEKYIFRDAQTNRLTNVFFCENDEESFEIIKKMIGSEGQGFFGDFKDIVLQNLEAQLLETTDPFDEPSSVEGREKLRLREVKKSLLKVFPFDVINLDFYGNFFPNYQMRFSDSCQTYREVLKLQKISDEYICKRFLIYLTVYTPIIENQINIDAFQQLKLTLFQNMGYKKFRNAFASKFGIDSPDNLDVYLKFILGFTKQILFKESYSIGWQPKIKDIFCYDRAKPVSGENYKMTTFVIEYKRNIGLETLDFSGAVPKLIEEDYLNQLEEIITNMPHFVPIEEDIPIAIKDDLVQVVNFRNDFLKKIGIFDERKFT